MTKPVKKTKNIDFISVVLPEPLDRETDHTNYTTTERRAEMLKLALAQGHFDLPVQKLAKLYGVSNGMISQDKDVIQGYVTKDYWKPLRVQSEAIAAKQKALRECLKSSHWRDANQISDSILKMCFELGIMDKTPEKINAKVENILFEVKEVSSRKPEPK